MCVSSSSVVFFGIFFFFKQKTAYEMRISDWSSDVCSSDLLSNSSVTMSMHREQQASNFQRKDYLPPSDGDRRHPFLALKALTQPTRMEIFRMVHSSVDGECSDVMASRVTSPLSNISLHLAVLSRTGLIAGQRQETEVDNRS